MAKLQNVKTLDMQDGKVTRVSYAGAEYYLVANDQVAVGDLALAVNRDIDVTEGAYYVIAMADEEDFRIYDDASDRHAFSVGDDDFVIFRKQSAVTPQPRGLELPTLAERVDDIDARVSALEGAEQDAVEPQPHTFKPGDYARLKSNKGALNGFKAGDIVRVGGESNGTYKLKVSCNGNEGYTDADNLEPADAPAPPKPTFKVGDYAKVADANYITLGGFNEGDLVKIAENSHGGEADYDYHVERVSDNYSGYAHKEGGYLEPATDAEVAQAKRAAKFAALGRKVDEYRTGDLVRVVRQTTGHAVGVVGEIVCNFDDDYPLVKAFGGDHEGETLFSYVELLAPVEARVDGAN